ncbi:asparagine synthase (glutamine-hydrolysing) [Mariniphaga anaerophila]|uniref:asparagine synthase (glutamine-hydrolyzing) n=1 Tax=Mariniphaga anaerophila TaxID=1484053 RepID=A0A1M5DC42_9BACT|nr:asparagine synthase-related protein [Mariniphaga anaerophila]SHF64603.1 asparagine synthase (glutamine-hydrolysing) [Mariniphaga anaerophila]
MGIELNDRFTKFNWTTNQKIAVTGFIWENENYISGEAFLTRVDANTNSFEQFKSFAEQLNGQFSIAIKKEEEKWVFCNNTCSFPLFYMLQNGKVILSDAPYLSFLNGEVPELDVFSEMYFLTFGFTPPGTTLFKNIFQVMPGECIRFGKQGKDSRKLFSTRANIEKNVQEKDLQHVLLSSFSKYYEHLKNKQVLLPLTRGYDSRLIACLLKEYGHNNVVCATWGRKNISEYPTAQKVARQLGYKHTFIEYNNKTINNFTASEQFERYIKYAGHLSSMPFLQDYFAVQFLKNNKIIDSQTVALPGHSGDFIMGSHLDNNMQKGDVECIISKIFSGYGSTYPHRKTDENLIKKSIADNFFNDKNIRPWQAFEKWDYLERQSKFICNSSLVFPFFGVDYLLPFFDSELVRFSHKIPFEQKLGTKLYNKTLENSFFKTHGVDFDLKPADAYARQNGTIKKRALKVAPYFLKKWYYTMEDPIFYREITQALMDSEKSFKYKHPLRPNAYNSYIMQWYLQLLKKKQPC